METLGWWDLEPYTKQPRNATPAAPIQLQRSTLAQNPVPCALFHPFPCTFSQAHLPALCCVTGRKRLHLLRGPLEVRPFRGGVSFFPTLSFYLSSGLKANPAASQHCSTQTFTKRDISYPTWQTIFTRNTNPAQAPARQPPETFREHL